MPLAHGLDIRAHRDPVVLQATTDTTLHWWFSLDPIGLEPWTSTGSTVQFIVAARDAPETALLTITGSPSVSAPKGTTTLYGEVEVPLPRATTHAFRALNRPLMYRLVITQNGIQSEPAAGPIVIMRGTV